MPPPPKGIYMEDDAEMETSTKKAKRLVHTYATPEYRRLESNKERNLRKRG
ncbi:hypothetical protein L7F22_004294, partial [Adiantum nelumboides]|nr:hypothetical protein [Adiantum nelumboides]